MIDHEPGAARPASSPSKSADAGTDLAEAVVVAVTALPGVAAMHSGRFGEVATYLPGRRVPGVQLRDDRAELHVVVRWGHDLLATAAAVQRTAGPVVARPVDVVIQDVVDPPDRTGPKEKT